MYHFKEIYALIYCLALAYFFFFLSRLLFIHYNIDLIPVSSWTDAFRLCYYGLRFDTTALLYLLSPFIVLSTLPGVNTSAPRHQKRIRLAYFIAGCIGLGLNFIDFVYYRFNLSRMNSDVLEVVKNEQNHSALLLHFINKYFYLLDLFVLVCRLWVVFYQRVHVPYRRMKFSFKTMISSVLLFLCCAALNVRGIHGGEIDTRPISPVHAMEKVSIPQHGDIVLNTPFNIIRSIGNMDVGVQSAFSPDLVRAHHSITKQYTTAQKDSLRPNIVLFILESMGREYWGALNTHRNLSNYESYTPFLDSLAQHSLCFPQFFANGRKSLHAVPSILAGIPSFKTAYISSPYATQKVESVVSIANALGYDTSFFHGAHNGTMGLQGFAA